MPKKIKKSLQNYFSNIKKPNPNIHFPPNISLSSSKDWILSGFKHPKTTSLAVSRTRNDDSATLSDVDRFLFENFKSLYTKDDVVQAQNDDDNSNTSVVLFDSPRLLDTPPSLRGSHRFFVNPGTTGSLIEEARTSSGITTSSNDVVSSKTTSSKTTSFSTKTTLDDANDEEDEDLDSAPLPDQCVAVLAISPNPYDDFRRSMKEMVGARLRRRESVDWGFMEELLFCYLNLNEKRSYKYILGAFVDLVVDLRRDSNRVPLRSRNAVRTGPREKDLINIRRRKLRDQ